MMDILSTFCGVSMVQCVKLMLRVFEFGVLLFDCYCLTVFFCQNVTSLKLFTGMSIMQVHLQCGTWVWDDMTLNSLDGSTLQCDTWLWDDMTLNSPGANLGGAVAVWVASRPEACRLSQLQGCGFESAPLTSIA